MMAVMPTTNGQSDLPFAVQEVNAINELLPMSIPQRILTHPTKSDVVEQIRHCSIRSEEHTSELQSHHDLVCRLLLEKKNKNNKRWLEPRFVPCYRIRYACEWLAL